MLDAQIGGVARIVGVRPVLLFLGLENIDRALEAREQILAVVGGEEGIEGFDFLRNHEQIVLNARFLRSRVG